MSKRLTDRCGSVHDLSDRIVLADARARLDRAAEDGPEALARWAREWGRPAVLAIEDAQSIIKCWA